MNESIQALTSVDVTGASGGARLSWKRDEKEGEYLEEDADEEKDD